LLTPTVSRRRESEIDKIRRVPLGQSSGKRSGRRKSLKELSRSETMEMTSFPVSYSSSYPKETIISSAFVSPKFPSLVVHFSTVGASDVVGADDALGAAVTVGDADNDAALSVGTRVVVGA
jgi:hypothetical protein